MDIETTRTLIDYNITTNRRVWDCAAGLTDDQYRHDFGYAFNTIHGQFAHILAAEDVWLTRMSVGASPSRLPSADDFPTRDALRQHWDELEARFRDFVWALTNADLARTFSYTNTKGTEFTSVIGPILLHLVNHGTDFRAQILYMLHQLGAPTIEQDLLPVLR